MGRGREERRRSQPLFRQRLRGLAWGKRCHGSTPRREHRHSRTTSAHARQAHKRSDARAQRLHATTRAEYWRVIGRSRASAGAGTEEGATRQRRPQATRAACIAAAGRAAVGTPASRSPAVPRRESSELSPGLAPQQQSTRDSGRGRRGHQRPHVRTVSRVHALATHDPRARSLLALPHAHPSSRLQRRHSPNLTAGP